jgi:sugar/nucleoside kinase (ribokinase family)
MHEVLVVGDAVVDIIVPFPRLSGEGKRRAEFFQPCIQGGGTAANTAVALSRLGVPVSFIGSVGDDQYGRYVRKDFEAEGVATGAMIIEPDLNTVGVFAFVDESGERYLWGWPRVDQAFKVIDESKVDFGAVREAAWVHSSGMALVHDSSARSSIIDIFREAKEAGVPTSFDLNLRADDGRIDPAFRGAVMEVVEDSSYVLGSGEEEFAPLGPGNWRENARALVREGRTIVVRLGREGAIGMAEGGESEEPAFPVEVVDTVGAGDVFDAAFIAALLRGAELRVALREGNAGAGFKVARKGARNSPRVPELRAFMEQYEE